MSADRTEALGRILDRVSQQGPFPAISRFVTEVVTTLRAPGASTQKIAALILKDFALTNAVLKVVNSAYYRSADDRAISTISRAIMVLGVDAVASIATGLCLFEQFAGRSDITEVKRLTVHALLTGLYARELAGALPAMHPEEAFISGMMHDVGRLVVAFYLPDEHRTILAHAARDGCREEQAALQVLGARYGDVGGAIARAWGLPDYVQEACGDDDDGPSVSRLRALVSCARALSAAATVADPVARAEALRAVREEHGDRVTLSPKQVEKIVERSTDRLNDIARALRLSKKDLGEAPVRPRPTAVPSPAAPRPHPTDDAQAAAAASRQTIFLHALEEIAGALAGSAPPGDVFMMILEGMYRGIGFERVLLALVSPDRERMRGRYGLGECASDIVAGFAVPLDAAGGALARVVTGARELLVHDTSDPEAVAGVPRAFLDTMAAHTFLLIPLVIRGAAIGAFYVDRTAAQGPITEAEQRSLRMLVNHAVLAVTHSQAA